MLEGRGRKARIRRRANFLCEYCRSPEGFAPSTFSIEHIVPGARGGGDDLENLALSCQSCNGHKYAKTEAPDPRSGKIVPLFHPRRQRWEEHFAWSADFTKILGKTPTGRATIDALCLNRDNLLRLRRLLWAAGEHPAQKHTTG